MSETSTESGTTTETKPEGTEQPGTETGTGEQELTWESLGKTPAEVKAQLDREREHSRTWETRAKTNLRELEELKRGSMDETERKIAEARDEGRRTALLTAGEKIARAALLEAMTGKVADPRDALELLDPKTFVGEDGEVDEAKVEKTVERLAKLAPAGKGKPPEVERNARTGGRPAQLTRADLKTMTPEQINKARKDGQLEDLLSGKIT